MVVKIQYLNSFNSVLKIDRNSQKRFLGYDTPHPKPFAPKNRLNRNSGDFTQAVANNELEANKEESRPLRSVLKKRPVSTYSVDSQNEAVLLSQFNESRTKLIRFQRGEAGFGWTIRGGQDSRELYKVCHF